MDLLKSLNKASWSYLIASGLVLSFMSQSHAVEKAKDEKYQFAGVVGEAAIDGKQSDVQTSAGVNATIRTNSQLGHIIVTSKDFKDGVKVEADAYLGNNNFAMTGSLENYTGQNDFGVGAGFAQVDKDKLLALIFALQSKERTSNKCFDALAKLKFNHKFDETAMFDIELGASGEVVCTSSTIDPVTNEKKETRYAEYLSPKLKAEISKLAFNKRLLVQASVIYDGSRSSKIDYKNFEGGSPVTVKFNLGLNFGVSK